METWSGSRGQKALRRNQPRRVTPSHDPQGNHDAHPHLPTFSVSSARRWLIHCKDWLVVTRRKSEGGHIWGHNVPSCKQPVASCCTPPPSLVASTVFFLFYYYHNSV